MSPLTRAKDLVKCPLCGYAFSAEESRSACSNCPFHRKCRLLRCPNCGYETPAGK
jgi:rubredoxin